MEKSIDTIESNRYRVQVHTCVDCADWIGRCRQGKKNKVASDVACPGFPDKMVDRWSGLWSKTLEAKEMPKSEESK